MGFGTQKLEESLQELLPEARILRMDADTTMTRTAYETGFRAFANGEYDILCGTQMIGKGLAHEYVMKGQNDYMVYDRFMALYLKTL